MYAHSNAMFCSSSLGGGIGYNWVIVIVLVWEGIKPCVSANKGDLVPALHGKFRLKRKSLARQALSDLLVLLEDSKRSRAVHWAVHSARTTPVLSSIPGFSSEKGGAQVRQQIRCRAGILILQGA